MQIEHLRKLLDEINPHGYNGLPVGGNASRILSEILLYRTLSSFVHFDKK